MIPYAQQYEPDNVVTLTLFLQMPSGYCRHEFSNTLLFTFA